MKLIGVVGARPNFMKIAPLCPLLDGHPKIDFKLLHTGQHYDKSMSDNFFEELKIRKPDIHLGIGSNTHAKQVADIISKFEDVCLSEKPDAILVVGDVNSTMACSIVASKLGIKIIHLEAGLRSFDRDMPEEINRIVTDALSDIYLTPSSDADENLIKEGVSKEKIFLVGNIMIDTLQQFLPQAEQSNIHAELKIEKKNYILVTLHRPSNVDDPENLRMILECLNDHAQKHPVIFPVHPRTMSRIKESGLPNSASRIRLIEPLGYLDFQALQNNATVVVTDSGGVQEETTALKIPCITMRENTERPITVTEGTNEIIGLDLQRLNDLIANAFAGKWKEASVPELWDGKTAQRILKVLEEMHA